MPLTDWTLNGLNYKITYVIDINKQITLLWSSGLTLVTCVIIWLPIIFQGVRELRTQATRMLYLTIIRGLSTIALHMLSRKEICSGSLLEGCIHYCRTCRSGLLWELYHLRGGGLHKSRQIVTFKIMKTVDEFINLEDLLMGRAAHSCSSTNETGTLKRIINMKDSKLDTHNIAAVCLFFLFIF